MLNAMTVDLEDWAQAVVDPNCPITERVVENTSRLLDFLDRHGVRATFFALGKVCERFGALLPRIAAAGHEIASHGYGHELVYRQGPERFEEDIRRSVALIEAQIGRRPLGYRAPAFSITSRSLWAGPILARLGFQYSSSIFPIAGRRYGIPSWPRIPAHWPDCDLVEFPLTTLRLGGRNLPALGGGYTRLLPAPVLASAIRRMNRLGGPAVIYLHPYELAVGEVDWFQRCATALSRRRRWMQALWRSRVEPRLSCLIKEFSFATMSESLRAWQCVSRADSSIEHPPGGHLMLRVGLAHRVCGRAVAAPADSAVFDGSCPAGRLRLR
jgi:polysaccharide deacetylase family protein (PEP-CTERM system associated)